MALPYDSDYEDEFELEPTHPFTTEVRDLFGASIITELQVEHHDCDVIRAKAAGRYSVWERCECETVAYYYVGRRADRELDQPAEYIAGPCLSLADLEKVCRDRIDRFRALAHRQKTSK